MDTNEKLSIKVNLADRFYPLRGEAKDEEKIRRAAKTINDKINQYKSRYSDKDNQDFLAMAALQLVTKVIESEEKADVSPLIAELESLDDHLGRIIEGI